MTSPTATGREHTADDTARAQLRIQSAKLQEHTFTAKAAPVEICGNIVQRMTFAGMQELTLASFRATVAVSTARVY